MDTVKLSLNDNETCISWQFYQCICLYFSNSKTDKWVDYSTKRRQFLYILQITKQITNKKLKFEIYLVWSNSKKIVTFELWCIRNWCAAPSSSNKANIDTLGYFLVFDSINTLRFTNILLKLRILSMNSICF